MLKVRSLALEGRKVPGPIPGPLSVHGCQVALALMSSAALDLYFAGNLSLTSHGHTHKTGRNTI